MYRYLEIFEYSINYVADEETRCSNHFVDRGKKSARENEEKKGEEKKVKEEKARKKAEKKRTKMKRKQKDNDDEQEKSQEQADASNPSDSTKSLTPSTLSEDLEDIFDISTEIEDRTTVLKEIKDIRHELNILRNLFDQQKIVIESFCQAVETGQKETGILVSNARPSLMDGIKRHIEVVDAMREAAKRPYQALEELSDLKQKQANVSEAQTARISGDTITVFTIVTIIFLSAFFMESWSLSWRYQLQNFRRQARPLSLLTQLNMLA